jgi:hypothetical protein
MQLNGIHHVTAVTGNASYIEAHLRPITPIDLTTRVG